MPRGFAWRTPPEVFASPHFDLGPFDLGLAHGAPGVIAVLASILAQGVEGDRARDLIDGAIEWLGGERLPSTAASRHSSSAGPAPTGDASRLAWCYGDLGIASALHLAGRIADVRAWREEAVALALQSGARDPAAARVRDAAICHGAAGVAHMLNRLHHAS